MAKPGYHSFGVPALAVKFVDKAMIGPARWSLYGFSFGQRMQECDAQISRGMITLKWPLVHQLTSSDPARS